MTSRFFKYGEEITWSLPFAFEYDVVWGAIYRHVSQYGIKIPRINAYGCPNCLWTGGRVAALKPQLDEAQIKKFFEYHSEINSTLTFTFTCTSLSENDLKSAYENYLLDVGLEYGAHFIVFDDRLRDYIKSKKSDAYVVASVIKPTFRFQGPNRVEIPTPENEAAYYNKLLKEYDMVVVRPEFSKYVLKNNPDLIDDLSRIEVLINQQCVYDCPLSPQHYQNIETSRLLNNKYNPVIHGVVCVKNEIPARKSIKQKILPHSFDTIQALIGSGVRHLKLRGRSDRADINSTAMLMYAQIFNFDGEFNKIAYEFVLKGLDQELQYFDENILRLSCFTPLSRRADKI